MKTKVLNKIIKIETELTSLTQESNNISLFTGIGGLPLFYLLLYKATNKKKYSTKFDETLYQIFESINKTNFGISYCNGLTGVSYMLNYLVDNGVVDDELNETLNFFDKTILEFYLKNTNNSDDIDFLQGSFGAAFYLNKRITENLNLKSKSFELFDRLIEIVEDNILKTEKAFNIIEYNDKTHRTNLGLAHGIVSFIIILSKIYTNYRDKKILLVVRKCVNCILKFKSEGNKTLSLFPGIAINKKLATYNIPLGWCYGDQTISIGLLKASQLLNDQKIKDEAYSIAYRNLKRNTIEKIFPLPMYDAGFCHGLSSIAYIHKKWYIITKDEKFYNLYENFISQILDFGEIDIGIAGYQKYIGNNKHEDAIGFLDGAIGIGIVLTDYLLGENNTKWDQFFYLINLI